MGKKLLSELQKLVSLHQTSPFVYKTGIDVVLLAFSESKPLFSEVDKVVASELVKNSLPLLKFSFSKLHGSLNPDLRQVAQRCRSGLQFLVEEFKNNPAVFQEIKPILTSSPICCVEEYIENTKGILPEYDETWVPQDLTGISDSHFWWAEGNILITFINYHTTYILLLLSILLLIWSYF